jgi:hypothetical protein
MLSFIPLIQRSRQAIDVSLPHLRSRGGRCRVTARVDGREVWFESADASLAAAPEAFGGAFLVPSLAAGRPLRLAGDVCETWALNIRKLTTEFQGLWYPATPQPIVVPAGRPRQPANATVLCFSGGVDSFHTLLAGDRAIDLLAYVVGYDVPLSQRQRARAVVDLLRDVARQRELAHVVISTNLRRHPLVKAPPWLRACAGPLAAIGHLLSASVGRILLSSTGRGFDHLEDGSRASSDARLGSNSLAVEHVAAKVTRLEKILAIAHEPLVQRHLRVCWKNVGNALNCGTCEKCIRSMLSLDVCGVLGRYQGFGRGHGLSQAIDALMSIEDVVIPYYHQLLEMGLSGSLRIAVRRLLDRSADHAIRKNFPVRSRPFQRRQAHPSPAVRRRLLGAEAFDDVFRPLIGQRVGYVRPEGNVGDHLIELAMIQLFTEYGIRWRQWRPDVASDAEGLDLLVFGGGGNMGMRYIGNHDLRGRALASGLPVVILPQSFTSAEDRPFARVFVRERGSLAFCPEGILTPDLALGLATAPCLPAVRDLGIFLRRDQERTGRKPFFARDPIRLRRDPLQYLALAARYRRIVTDRLHFAIAGLHAGREVTLLANDYHKNRSLHETWLADLGCRFADNASEASRRAA